METPTEAENSNPWTKLVGRNKSPKKRRRCPRKIYNYIERYLLGTDVRPGQHTTSIPLDIEEFHGDALLAASSL